MFFRTGSESDTSTPPCPENDASSSLACQDGNPDTGTPDSSAFIAKPFSLSGKSTMCISQGSAAVRSLPGVGIFSFRICPPTEMPKTLSPDSQKTSSSLSLPGGFTLIQLPQVSVGDVKTSGLSAETETAAAASKASNQYQGSLCKQGSETAGQSNLGAQIDRTSLKRKTIIAPVVVPPMVLRPPPFRRTSQKDSGISLDDDTSHKTSQQGSRASLAGDASRNTSKHNSGTPKAIFRKAIRAHRGQDPKTSPIPSGIAAGDKERHQRALDMGFRKLKEVLHMTNLKVTQQDILDQVRLPSWPLSSWPCCRTKKINALRTAQ